MNAAQVKWESGDSLGESTWDYNHDQRYSDDEDTSYQNSGSERSAILKLPGTIRELNQLAADKRSPAVGYNAPVYRPLVYKTKVQRSPDEDSIFPKTIFRTQRRNVPQFN